MIRFLFLLPALLTACAALPSASPPVTGEWGGTHVGLSLKPNGGTLAYDCAAGTVIGPLMLDRDGTFIAEGTHTPGWGGPEIAEQNMPYPGRARPTYHVDYSGKVRGNKMSLQGRLENGVLLGPFALRRGAEPIIFRCM